MRIPPSFRSEVLYARDIVKAGLGAANCGAKNAADENKPVSLTEISRCALAPAVLGAAVGIVGVYLRRRGRPGTQAIVGGLVGCAVGFAGGVAWSTRDRTKVWSHRAAQNVQAVRDARWLEKNPVAYA